MDLKYSFMQKVLREYNEEVMKLMRRTMAAKRVGKTGAGEQSIAGDVSPSGAGVESKLSFKEYLRFVDMGVGRGHPLGGLKSVSVTLKSMNKTGQVFKKDNTFKPKKIYSSIAYGKLTWMYNRMLYGYTEEAIEQLKTELQAQNNTPTP